MSSQKIRYFFAFLGNLFEHYDTALFTLLIPFLSQKLFPQDGLALSLVKGFSLIPLTFFTKPLGALFFSWLAKFRTRAFSLKFSYLGMAIVTGFIGIIPLNPFFKYNMAILVILRLSQGFFSSGETINGAMYVMQASKDKERNFFSALFDASSLAGYLIASLAIYVFIHLDLLEQYWRVLFFIGSLAFLPALFLKTPQDKTDIETRTTSYPSLLTFLQLFFCSGLSYAFFALAFTFSNGALPLFSKLTSKTIQNHTTLLFLIDMIFLPLAGLLGKKITSLKLMKLSLCLAFFIVPFSIFMLPYTNVSGVFIIRCLWVILGATFSANLYDFYYCLYPSKEQTYQISLATSLGSCFLGHTFSSSSLFIFQIFQSSLYIGIFFSCLCLLSFMVLQKKSKKLPYLV